MWVGWFQSSLWGNISLLWAQHPHRRPSDSPVSSPVVWATDPHGESGKPERPVVVTGRVRMCDGVVCMNSFFGGGVVSSAYCYPPFLLHLEDRYGCLFLKE